MTTDTLTVKIRVRWWLRAYLCSVVLCIWRQVPSPTREKVQRVVRRGIYISL